MAFGMASGVRLGGYCTRWAENFDTPNTMFMILEPMLCGLQPGVVILFLYRFEVARFVITCLAHQEL